MTRTIATKFGCLPFKTECNVPIHILPTVYVHLRHNQLCLREYSSKRTIQQFCVYFSVHAMRKSTHALWDALSVCVCFSVYTQKTGPNWVLSCVVRLIHMFALLLLPHIDFLTFYAPCSKFIIAYVPPVLKLSFFLNEPLPKSSLPNIFVSFLFTDENVNTFTS